MTTRNQQLGQDNTSLKKTIPVTGEYGTRDEQLKICYDVSPHLLDLKWETKEESRAEAIHRAVAKSRTPSGWLTKALDERIYLRDIRARQLSLHPR